MEMDPLALRDLLQSAFVTPLTCVQRAYWQWMAVHGGSVVNAVAAITPSNRFEEASTGNPGQQSPRPDRIRTFCRTRKCCRRC
jgi:hypothetical protein